MSKSQSIGVVTVLALILVIVGVPMLKNAFSAPGIQIREPASSPHETAKNLVDPPTGGARTGLAGAAEHADSKGIGDAASVHANPTPTVSGPDAVQKSSEPMNGSSQKQEVVVQVAGAVKRPGVYHLSVGARYDDAVKAAGGLAPGANAASVNLAARAADGSQLYVKTVKEQPTGGATDEITAPYPAGLVGQKKPAGGASKHAVTSASSKGGASSKPSKLKDPSEGKININTASAEELQRLPNIGPAMAEKVIAYRLENHGFLSLEDLMQVSGIGPKKYAKIAPLIKLH